MSGKVHEGPDEKKLSTKDQICKYLLKTFLFFRYYLDYLIDKIFSIYYDSKRQYIKPVSNPLLLKSATSLAKEIRERKLTAEEVVSAFIARIQEVNPVINAIVDDRFDEALKEAKEIDLQIATGQILDVDFREKPFLGVPFTSKESTACKGLSYTFGLKKREGRKATFDATCVELMKNAGGILLGVSNVPQLNLWPETHNPLYGITKNPYNSTRNVGGSSGGESSILAACGSPLGIGTDIGGSARIPASMCGIFGHKVTCGIISTKGLTFRTGEEFETMVSVGPMTKYAEDLIPFMKVLGGSNIEKLNLDAPVDIRKLKIYYVYVYKDPFVSPMRREMKEILLRARDIFIKKCETLPEKLELEYAKHTTKLWKYWMSKEGTNFKNDINDRQGEVNVYVEILKRLFGRSDLTLATTMNLINGLLKNVDDKWAVDITKQIKDFLIEKLGNNGVLLFPSGPFPASYHHTSYLRPYNFNFYAIWNVLKFPVTQVPMGLGKDGLPLGIQVVAAPYQDRLCIAVARELENHFKGFTPPA